MTLNIKECISSTPFKIGLDEYLRASGIFGVDFNPGADIQRRAAAWMTSSGYLMGFCRRSPISIDCFPDIVNNEYKPMYLRIRLIMDPLRSVAGRGHPLMLGGLNENHALIRYLSRRVAEKELKMELLHADYLFDISTANRQVRLTNILASLGSCIVCKMGYVEHRQELIEYALACYASNPPKQNVRVHITPDDVDIFRRYTMSSAVRELVAKNETTAWILDESINPPSHFTGPSPMKPVAHDYRLLTSERIEVGVDGKICASAQTGVD